MNEMDRPLRARTGEYRLMAADALRWPCSDEPALDSAEALGRYDDSHCESFHSRAESLLVHEPFAAAGSGHLGQF